jgi:MerR family transcriptional regulator, light-induced transcriptional regulator
MIPSLESAPIDTNTSSLSISAVERDTGLSKDTLRVWERRYGFPMPERDAFGERIYSAEQLTKLRVICRLIDSGYRPGKIVRMSVEHLESLTQHCGSLSNSPTEHLVNHADLELLLNLCKTHQVEELRRVLLQASLRMGLGQFVIDLVAPLTARVGEAWAKGHLEIFEEHLYSESIQVVMRNAIGNIPVSQSGPKVLLTTFPTEPHGLGLLMAEATLALHGARCFSLGIQTPVRDVVRASQAQTVQIVALSFSSFSNPNQVIDGLNELRHELADDVEIWAGGLASVLRRKPPAGIRVVTSLNAIADALEDWRSAHDLSQSAVVKAAVTA